MLIVEPKGAGGTPLKSDDPSRSRWALPIGAAYAAVSLLWLVGVDLAAAYGPDAGTLSWAEHAAYVAAEGLIFLTLSGVAAFYYVKWCTAQRLSVSDQFRAVADRTPVALAFTDTSGVVQFANPTLRRLLNVAQSLEGQVRLVELLRLHGARLPAEGLPGHGELQTTIHVQTPSGTVSEVVLHAARLDPAGHAIGWVVSAQDVTAMRGAQRRDALQTHVLAVSPDGIMVADATQRDLPLIYVNPRFEAITGFNAAEALGQNARFLQGGDRQQPEIASLRAALRDGRRTDVTLRNYRRDGTMFWTKLTLEPVLASEGAGDHAWDGLRVGQVRYWIGILRDVSETVQVRARLEELAYADPLTQLMNRTRFSEQLADALQRRPMLVAKTDISKFHDINTSLGWESGDALLIETGRRLTAVNPGGLVGRLSGNEFAVATEAADPAATDAILADMRRVLAERYVLPGVNLDALSCIGYAVVPAGTPVRTALRQAAVALHEAKQAKTGHPHFFDRAVEAAISGRVQVTNDLKTALTNGDFVLHFQPKVALDTGVITGAEALIRWQHPAFGLQPPSRFINIAEQTGLILDIGEWAMEHCMLFAQRVNQARLARPRSAQGQASPLVFSVNVSQVQMRHRDVAAMVRETLARTGVDPSWICLELTENVFTDSSTNTLHTFKALRDLGVGLSIDDFGTGYSSLRYISSFPITEIKIDRSFVNDIETNEHNQAIVEAVVKIGATLKVDVTAEGMETADQLAKLRDMQCQYGQGYFFSLPLESEDFLWLTEGHEALPVPAAPVEG